MVSEFHLNGGHPWLGGLVLPRFSKSNEFPPIEEIGKRMQTKDPPVYRGPNHSLGMLSKVEMEIAVAVAAKCCADDSDLVSSEVDRR